jgi:hypothetical protein|tara:strand:+ start:62 stop:469 length:408 start_codon:yes stop_codon:yes gene_type:complete
MESTKTLAKKELAKALKESKKYQVRIGNTIHLYLMSEEELKKQQKNIEKKIERALNGGQTVTKDKMRRWITVEPILDFVRDREGNPIREKYTFQGNNGDKILCKRTLVTENIETKELSKEKLSNTWRLFDSIMGE